MTISDKIRIYELSRDLNLENKDILDAAQKLSISVKSHSSSISLGDAKKIKNLINKKNSGEKIISVNKPSLKQLSEKPTNVSKQNLEKKSPYQEKISKNELPQKPLLIRPTNKPNNSRTNTEKLDKPQKPNIISKAESQRNLRSQDRTFNTSKANKSDLKEKQYIFNQDKKPLRNSITPPIKNPAKPPIQLIQKPKNLLINTKRNDVNITDNRLDNKNKTNRFDQNINKSANIQKDNLSNQNTPELVGAPIRKTDLRSSSNKQNFHPKQNTPNRKSSPNKPSMPNRQTVQNKQFTGKPNSLNRQVNHNNKSRVPNKPGGLPRQGEFNKTGSRFNNSKSSGFRRPVSPNELMQLQKTNNSDKEKISEIKKEKPKIEIPKQKAKAPNNRPSASPTSKKPPHRSFTNSSKKPGKTDWDDSAKLEALRNKNPHKQRQKVHIIGENDDSLTSETSGYSGEKISILSASLARPKKEKPDDVKLQKASKQLKKKKKETTRQRQKRRAMELRAAKEAKQVRPEMIIVPEDNLTVQELADKLRLESSEIIKSLFFKGITATVTQSLDLATIETVAEEFGVPVLQDDVQEAAKKTVDMLETDDIDSLIKRPPVITVMGHVDHGKTSLLDSIRESRVASGEAGGITQHIGAYQVEFEHESKKKKLTFLDTPGHEAFTAMRARGTKVTDVAVLVVAADDGCRPQTLEAISHARAAKVPIVVAINKIDKEGASPERVKQELSEKDLIAEDWGGDVVMVPVSAIKKQNIDKLLEMILLVSEVEDLQANPERLAKGTVIEAHLDKAKGPVATLLVQNGTLKSGDVLAAGSVLGKIRAMVDEHGNRIKEAGPSFPVEALGFSEVPTAGDEFEVYPDEKTARSIVGERATDARATKLAQQMASRRVSLASLSNQANDGELKELNLILKADVQGSVEAILGSLEQLPKNEVQVRVLLSAPGEITETDIDLAAASGSVIIGFNTSLASGAQRAADANDVDIREYEVIYKLLEDIQSAMEGLLEPDLVEESLGKAEVRATFAVGKGAIAGCYIQDGKLQRNCSIRIFRSDRVIFEGNLDSLKRSKDDVKEVNTGFECGVGCDKFSSWNEGDIIEAFKFVTKKRTLSK